jgi:hypothetical protein
MRKQYSIQIRDFSFLMDLRDCPYATHVLLCMQKSYGFALYADERERKPQFSHYQMNGSI